MSRKRELQKQLGSGYIYERYLDERSLRQLKRQPPEDFSEMVIAALTVGCLRLNAVLYRSDETLIQGCAGQGRSLFPGMDLLRWHL